VTNHPKGPLQNGHQADDRQQDEEGFERIVYQEPPAPQAADDRPGNQKESGQCTDERGSIAPERLNPVASHKV
jgi:hypothetical protein